MTWQQSPFLTNINIIRNRLRNFDKAYTFCNFALYNNNNNYTCKT